MKTIITNVTLDPMGAGRQAGRLRYVANRVGLKCKMSGDFHLRFAKFELRFARHL
jgi:hypothetical protein